MSWKTLESPGSNQRHLADRKIALYQLRQILNYKTDGSLVNFRHMTFQSTNKTTEDVDNGHSKECQSFDVDLHCNIFKIRFRAVYTQAYGGACSLQARSHPEHAAAKRGHHRLFFFGPRKRGGGGFVRTLRTPLGYVPALLAAADCVPETTKMSTGRPLDETFPGLFGSKSVP